MNAFFIDLDGTLIFSHRSFHEGYIPVEEYKEQQITFIEKNTLDILEERIRNAEFIPVTSRTKAQYDRIELFKEKRPAYALLDNGGVLLVNGEIDESWYRETRGILGNSIAQLHEIASWASQYARVKIQDEIVLFIKAEDEQICRDITNGLKQYSGFYSFMHKDKLYVCSEHLTKGAALKRFTNRYPVERSVAAGDSEVDFSMAAYADVFVTNEDNRAIIDANNVVFTPSRDIALTALSMN